MKVLKSFIKKMKTPLNKLGYGDWGTVEFPKEKFIEEILGYRRRKGIG